MIKKNFTTVEKLRNAIVEQHKKEPNVVILINNNVVIELERTTRVLTKENGRRVRLLAIEYEGELLYFNDSKKKILFLLQEKRTTS